MSYIDSYDQKTVEEIKDYCLLCSSDRNLSSKVKKILDANSINVLEKIERNYEVDIEDFINVIDAYFERLEFSNYNYDDEKVQACKEEVGLFFQYIDTLNLEESFQFQVVESFLMRFQGNKIDGSRGIYDILMLDSIRKSNIMTKYLNSKAAKDFCDNNLIVFVKNLYSLFDKFNAEEMEKIKYVFHSSFELVAFLLDEPDVFDICFPKVIVSSFNKEDLSILLRMFLVEGYKEFFKADEKYLKVVIAMNNYMKNKTCHKMDLLDSVLTSLNDVRRLSTKKFNDLLIEYYDRFYEESIKNDFKDDEVFKELLLFILETGGNFNFLDNYLVSNLDDFCKARKKFIDDCYTLAFGKNFISDFNEGIYDEDNLFDIKNFRVFKDLYYRRVYGITYDNAKYIYNKYGKFLKVCEKEFLEEDKDIYKMIKNICDVYKMNIDDSDKVDALKNMFLDYIKEKGLYRDNKDVSFVTIRYLIDKMYMKTFSNNLFDISKGKVLYTVGDVPVIDAGVDFSMIVNCANGVGNYYALVDNFQKRYNSSIFSNNQGICVSFINNENLGLISLNGPIFGYNNFDINTLHAMGIGDIYSDTQAMNLKNSTADVGQGRYFLTAKKYVDYTRFGYNEMVFDRFLFNDKDNIYKVQPSYIVVYKMDEDYHNTRMYKRGLKAAKEFGVPLVLIDVEKVKKHEKEVIIEMEDKLFSSKVVNKRIMHKIINRYMNNYTGSLTIVRSRDNSGNKWNYKSDFSVDGLSMFLEKVEDRFEDLNEDEIREWTCALKECFDLEKKKNSFIDDMQPYAHSLQHGEFLLKDIYFLEEVEGIRLNALDKYLYKSGLIEEDKVTYDTGKCEVEFIVNLANMFFDHTYVTVSDYHENKIYMTKKANLLSEEEKDAYGFLISYLLGDFSENYFDNLHNCDLSKLRFNLKDRSIASGFDSNSIYHNKIYQSPLLMKIASHISAMDDDEFLKMFQPITSEYAGDKLGPFNFNLLSIKNKIYDDFCSIPLKDKENNLEKTLSKKK